MNLLKRCLIAIYCFAGGHYARAQSIGVDSRGNSVFTFYSKYDARVEVSTDEPLSVSYVMFPVNVRYDAKKGPTVTKFRGFPLKISMLNSQDFPILTSL